MNWIFEQIQQLCFALYQVFTVQLFELGGKPFSLSLLVKLIFFVLIAIIIARTISRLINRWLLARFRLDRGTREAIALVLGYVLALFGVLIVLQSVGINLSSLTVILGAVGIGFGFGFQTLAGNFLSGLTILFEQAIKVGDFVEVNELLGTVEKISIRSTVIRTLDGFFVIVPNNYFVDNQIINWSYQDLTYRLHIPVGVAYGSDPVLVTETLLAAARKEARVLSYPSPKVFFTGFGDNALNFELLVWANNPPETELIKSALHFLIEAELRYRKISIPFPQRDLHLPNLEPLTALFQSQTERKPKPFNPNLEENQTITKSPSNWTLRDLLRRISYFETCSSQQIRELIEYGYRQLFPANHIVCQEGEAGDSFYIILAGEVEVFSTQTGSCIHIANLHEGEFFGEISLLMGTPRTASVRTLGDTILFVVGLNDLQRLMRHHQDLADQIAQKLAERQQSLAHLGLKEEEVEMSTIPFLWIRKRINTIFGL